MLLNNNLKSISGSFFGCILVYGWAVLLHGMTIKEDGLGPVRLGMRYEEQLEELQWGEPDQEFMSDDQVVLVYESRGVTFVYQVDKTNGDITEAVNSSILTEVIITSSIFSDDEERVIGHPCANDSQTCSQKLSGVCFECADDGYISKVRIRRDTVNDEG